MNGGFERVRGFRGLKDAQRTVMDEHPQFRTALLSMPNQMSRPLLIPGVALACCLANLVPELSARDKLKVVIYVEHGIETLDEGRWFHIAGCLLGINIELSIAQYGQPFEMDGRTAGWAALSSLQPPSTLDPATFTSATFPTRPDVVVLPNAAVLDDVRDPRTWRWVTSVLSKGIPVVGWCYDALERDIVVEIFRAAGFASSTTFESPCSTEERVHPRVINHPGRSMYRLHHDPSAAFDEAAYDSLVEFTHRHAVALQNDEVTPWGGQIVRSAGRQVAVGGCNIGIDLRSGAYVFVDVGSSSSPSFRETDLPSLDMELIGELSTSSGYKLARRIDELVSAAIRANIEQDDEDEMDRPLFGDLTIEGMREGLQSLMSGPEFQGIFGGNTSAVDQMVELMTGKSGMEMNMPMFLAVENDDPAAIVSLGREGFDPNEYDQSGWAPMTQAAADSSLKAIPALISIGADVDIPHRLNGMTPLMVALQRGQNEAALVLLKAGANIDALMLGTSPFAREMLEQGLGGDDVQAWYKKHGKK